MSGVGESRAAGRRYAVGSPVCGGQGVRGVLCGAVASDCGGAAVR
jgi:hypothetical protein